MRALLGLRIALGLTVLALLGGCQGSGSTPAPARSEASLDIQRSVPRSARVLAI